MRFLHLGLVVSLVLTTKASDPNPDDRVSENPTGRAAVHGHPKVVAGSGDYRHAPPPFPYNSKHNTEPHYHDTYEDSNDVSDYYKDDYHRGVEEANIHKPVTEMTEDDAMMQSQELANAVEPNEAMTEEMSEHDEMISIHEFKEVLHELVIEAVDKIVKKKAGFLGKLKTARQNLIAHDGEATGRNTQQFGDCQCSNKLDPKGRGDCNHILPATGLPWCFLERFSACPDEKPSFQLRGFWWSHIACGVGKVFLTAPSSGK